MKIIRYPLILAAIASISACSNTPSEGDIKEALTIGLLKNCSILSIDKIKKTNGIPDANSDKIYVVQTEFTVKTKPIKENQKIASDIPGYVEKIKEMRSKQEFSSDLFYEVKKKIQKENSDLSDTQAWELAKNNPEVKKLKEEIENFKKNFPYFYSSFPPEMVLKDTMLDHLEVECSGPNGLKGPMNTHRRFFPKEIADFKDSYYTEFTGKFTLRKTDNGWRLAN